MIRRALFAVFVPIALLCGIASAEAASECFTITACGTALTNQYTAGTFNACVVDINGNTCTSGGNGPGSAPAGSVQISAAFSGADTASATATLAAAPAGHFTWICSFTVSGLGATASTPVTVTVATLIGGNTLSYSYVFPAGAGVASTPLVVNYSPCVSASVAATAITITVPGAAGNTATQINATGYQF